MQNKSEIATGIKWITQMGLTLNLYNFNFE